MTATSRTRSQPEPKLPLRDDGSVDTTRMPPPGLRSPHDFGQRHGLRGNPRPDGEMTHKATLLRGRTYRFAYSPSALVLAEGVAVPINVAEFEKLSTQHERLTYHDGATLMVRYLPVWSFATMDGTPVDVAVPADEQVIQQAV